MSSLSVDLNMGTHFLLKSTLVFLLAILFIKLLVKIRSKPHKNGKLPPSAETFPLIRVITAVITGQEPTLIREQYEKLGSVFTMNFWPRKFTFLIEPDVVEYFIKASEKMLGQKDVYNNFTLPILGPGVLFDANPVEKRRQVGVLVQGFQTSRLSSYVSLMVAEVEEYFSKWKDCGMIDLKQELHNLIFLVGSRCLLGEDARATMVEKFSSLVEEVGNGVTPLVLISPYFPIPTHIRRDRARAEVSSILSNIINERIKSGTSNEDLLQSFINKYKDDNHTSKDQIIGLILMIFLAAHHTTSVSSFWNGVYLLHHPKFLSAAIEEQKEIMRRHGNKIDFDTLGEMGNLYRCMKESARLQPTSFIILRYSRSEFTIRSKEGREFVIPKGQYVAVAPSVLNRLPFLYKDPDTYDPDRFADGREEDKIGGPFSNINFGGGRNACPGGRFGYLTIQVIWSILLRKFELELPSPFFSASDLSSMYSRPPKKVLMRYKRRELSLNN